MAKKMGDLAGVPRQERGAAREPRQTKKAAMSKLNGGLSMIPPSEASLKRLSEAAPPGLRPERNSRPSGAERQRQPDQLQQEPWT